MKLIRLFSLYLTLTGCFSLESAQSNIDLFFKGLGLCAKIIKNGHLSEPEIGIPLLTLIGGAGCLTAGCGLDAAAELRCWWNDGCDKTAGKMHKNAEGLKYIGIPISIGGLMLFITSFLIFKEKWKKIQN